MSWFQGGIDADGDGDGLNVAVVVMGDMMREECESQLLLPMLKVIVLSGW